MDLGEPSPLSLLLGLSNFIYRELRVSSEIEYFRLLNRMEILRVQLPLIAHLYAESCVLLYLQKYVSWSCSHFMAFFNK